MLIAIHQFLSFQKSLKICEDLLKLPKKKTYPSSNFCRVPTETKCLVFRDVPKYLKQIGQLAFCRLSDLFPKLTFQDPPTQESAKKLLKEKLKNCFRLDFGLQGPFSIRAQRRWNMWKTRRDEYEDSAIDWRGKCQTTCLVAPASDRNYCIYLQKWL